jgi:hypothetical protein
MPSIKNIDQLRAEIARLKTVRVEQESQMRSDFQKVKEDYRPINILLRTLSDITGLRFDKSNFLKGGLLYGLSLLFQRFILKTEKKAEDAVYGLVDVLFEKIQEFISKHTSHQARREERKDEKEGES